MEDVLTLILGGGRGSRLYPLTKFRSEPAVTVAGKYRLIDIPLSNCINSGFQRIYVLTQFQSVSLHRHITNGYKFSPFTPGFVEVLAARQTNEDSDWYRGTAHALQLNLHYIQNDDARDVLILYGDQLYRMDFSAMLQAHRFSRADVTLAVTPVTRDHAPDFGIAQVQGARLAGMVEKPGTEEELDALQLDPTWLGARGLPEEKPFLANTGVYLFRRQALLDLLDSQPEATDLVRQILIPSVGTHQFYAHLFTGYWEDLGTIRTYHAAHLDLTRDDPPFDFHRPEGVIYTRMRFLPAARTTGARLEHTLLSDGCVVGSGSQIRRSVIGIRTHIGEDVHLRDTVINGANSFESPSERAENQQRGIPSLGIGDRTVIERAILDKDCRIGKDVRIINSKGLQEDEGSNYVIRDGIVVIPKGAVVPDGTEI
jgi:glucose-1-phosphate adenylyltransferase